jgi:predicted amidohydrolase YtcJ
VLLRQFRPALSDEVLDLRAEDGVITALAPSLAPHAGEEVHDAGGNLAIPGLWDHHVHVGQTAHGYARLDTSGTPSVDEMLRLVADVLAARRADGHRNALVGFGHRLVDMAGEPTVAALDATTPDHTPVVLIGGDAHHAWMNSAALSGLGLPARRGVVAEDEWFDAVAHLDDLPGVAAGLEAGVEHLQRDALARGVVGLTDMEWAENWRLWQRRTPRLRVRTATYTSDMDGVPGPTGSPVGDSDLVTMGPLKVIADGSLGSRSAYCRHPYAYSAETDAAFEDDARGYGVLSAYAADLAPVLARGRELGLSPAVHAIGDAAVGVVLDAFDAAGVRGGRIEHAQLLADPDIAAMARLGVCASVQPAHLLDDRDPTTEVWPDDAASSYRFRDLASAGVPMLFGSDSPVAPVDPWLAMAAAVHRSGDERPAWFPAQQLQPREALAASTDGHGTMLAVGAPADLVLLDADPFADVPTGPDGLMDEQAAREAAARLWQARVRATFVAGGLAFSA